MLRMTSCVCSVVVLSWACALSVVAQEDLRGEPAMPTTGPVARAIVESQPSPTSFPATAAPAASTSWPPGLLMDGLDKIGVREPMDKLGLRVWGFEEAGFTGNLTNGQDTLFGHVFDARRVNNVRQNQLRLTMDRPYDAGKSFDLGFRVDGLFGGDAMLTHSPGLLDDCGHGQGDCWADVLQAYGQMWFKTGESSGLEITAGKFVTTHGVEVIDATGNPLYSHSFLFGYAIPFTHTGVKANYVWNANFSTYFAIVQGWEVFNDNNSAHSYMAGGAWTSSEQIGGHAKDLVYFNVITGPEQDHNESDFRTVVDATYTHWWSEKLSQSINGDWGTEQNVAGIGQANWYGVAHYLTYAFNDKVSATWRAEWFADDSGARIGVPGNYVENTVGLWLTPWPEHPVLKNLSLRPELRWDHSDQAVFGNDHDQMTVAMDLIFKF